MQPPSQKTFRFACHKALPCFTRCCAGLNLVLTPYDILRLRSRLALPSEVFLDRFTTAVADPVSGLPMVRLSMKPDSGQHCPFLTPEGCSVYSDRPSACRLYPLGRAASQRDGGTNAGRYYFTVKESHCLGWQEDKEWTIAQWLSDQGLDEYNEKNAAFLRLTVGRPPGTLKALGDPQRRMYYTACYNLDGFRRLILGSAFRKWFDIGKTRVDRLRADDIVLMDFAFRWLRFSLFGEGTFQMRDPISANHPNRNIAKKQP